MPDGLRHVILRSLCADSIDMQTTLCCVALARGALPGNNAGLRMTKRIVLLQALASTPNDIMRLLRALRDEDAAWREDDASWSCADVVAHLVFVEHAYLERLQRVLVEATPYLPVIHPERIIVADSDIRALAGQFHEAREATIVLLRDISPGDWQRPAVHETKGATTLRFLVQMLVEHDIEHTNQLVEIQQRLRAVRRREETAA